MDNENTQNSLTQNIADLFSSLIKDLTKKIDNLESKTENIIEFQKTLKYKETDGEISVIAENDIIREINKQFEKIDTFLGRYVQKTNRDNAKLLDKIDRLETLLEEVKTQSAVKQGPILTVKKAPPLIKTVVPEKEADTSLIPDKDDLDRDKQEVRDLRSYFTGKDIFTTGALKIVEDTRDNLLFDRETEAPYRAFAAKIFREVLSLIKQEKDFSTLSTQSIKDIQHRIEMLYEKI